LLKLSTYQHINILPTCQASSEAIQFSRRINISTLRHWMWPLRGHKRRSHRRRGRQRPDQGLRHRQPTVTKRKNFPKLSSHRHKSRGEEKKLSEIIVTSSQALLGAEAPGCFDPLQGGAPEHRTWAQKRPDAFGIHIVSTL